MKFSAFFTLLFVVTTNPLLAQHLTKEKDCPIQDFPEINIFIPGYADSILESGHKVRVIRAASLANGFELVSSDSSLIIEHFHLVFDDSEGNLYSKNSKGKKIVDDEINIVPMNKIRTARIITIENIIVQYKNTCYRVKPQLYLSL